MIETAEHNKANVGFSRQTIGDVQRVTDRRYMNLVWEKIDQIGQGGAAIEKNGIVIVNVINGLCADLSFCRGMAVGCPGNFIGIVLRFDSRNDMAAQERELACIGADITPNRHFRDAQDLGSILDVQNAML
ncbi:hypothetical protein FHT72_003177 [Rhizobium sp. BK077]|nr:hypothetical protein [Rhizobium sp. BK112]MBB3368690.1 hypothetical protein [Rhizobium sp. BK077]MBB4180957.1 hypothetical protein [Rhizobium sp. BK109]